MPKQAQRSRQRPHGAATIQRTIEERLHDVGDRVALLADFLELQAVAPDYVRGELPGAEACRGAAVLAQSAGWELRTLLTSLPISVLNTTASVRSARRRRNA